MILDVGCGAFPRGSINIDIALETDEVFQDGRLTPTKADILAAGEYLPFIDNSFDEVLSIHAIEHSKTPIVFLKELVRVSNKFVFVKTPHKEGRHGDMPHHHSLLNFNWFKWMALALSVDEISIELVYDKVLILEEGIRELKRPYEWKVRIKK
jgi:ubiquinone/menaquinone biosynthesis C-methylase UbiE